MVKVITNARCFYKNQMRPQGVQLDVPESDLRYSFFNKVDSKKTPIQADKAAGVEDREVVEPEVVEPAKKKKKKSTKK